MLAFGEIEILGEVFSQLPTLMDINQIDESRRAGRHQPKRDPQLRIDDKEIVVRTWSLIAQFPGLPWPRESPYPCGSDYIKSPAEAAGPVDIRLA